MSSARFSLFETPIGMCGLVWREGAVVGFQLPEREALATRERLSKRFPLARETGEDDGMDGVIVRVRGVLAGAADDLRDIEIDLEGCNAFARRVYAVTREIAPGTTLTYGEVTRRIGEGPQAARSVGRALGANPVPVIIPCHRVTAASGKAGGFSAPGGVGVKLRLLQIEARHGPGLPLFS